MTKINISSAIETAKAIAGDRIRRVYDARVGRTEDNAVATGLPSEVFVRINNETESTTALFPVGFDISTLEYDAPVKVRKENGRWVIITTDAIAGVDFWEGAPPGTSLNNAPVVVKTSFATLPNAVVLADLSTGYLKVTTGTGVLSSQAVPIPVSDGGTGATSFTANRLLIGNGTSAISTIATGASGTYLRSNGTVGSFATLNMSDAGAGTLVVGRGGTGATTHTANAILVGNGASAITSISPSTSGNILQSNGTLWQSVAPSFSASVITSGTLGVARGGTGLSTVTAGSLMLGNGTSPFTLLAGTVSGQVVTWNGTTWVAQAPVASGTVTSVAVASNDLTVSGSPVTTNGTINVDVPDNFAHLGTTQEGQWELNSQVNAFFKFASADEPAWYLYRLRGTYSTQTQVLNNDILGSLYFTGNNGTTSDFGVPSSLIRAVAVDNFSVGDTPSKLEFLTTADGSSTPALALTLNADKSAVFTGAVSGITSLTASGNISSSGGSLSANTTVTAGTGITATTGNIAASSGNLSASGSVSASSASITGNITADKIILDTTVGTSDGGIGFNSTNKALNTYTAGIEQYLGGILFRGTANKTVASTAVETSLIPTSGVGTVTLPANFFTSGRMLRFILRGNYGSVNTTDTLTFRVKLGSTAILTSTARAREVTLTRGWVLMGEIACYSTGVSGSFAGGAEFREQNPTDTVDRFDSATGVTVNTTTSQTFDVTVQWSASNAANTISTFTCIVEAL